MDIEALEKAVDARGLAAVLSDLADVCFLKAQHIEEAWQDETTAKGWTAAGLAIGTANNRILRGGIVT